MIAVLLPLLIQAATPVQPPAAPPPASWPSLPLFPYRATPVLTPDMMRFVRTEVEAGRCAAAVRSGATTSLRVDLLVMTMAGRLKRVTPIAIRCPAVEQYAAGLVTGLARDNADLPGQGSGSWYRTSLTFTWTQ